MMPSKAAGIIFYKTPIVNRVKQGLGELTG